MSETPLHLLVVDDDETVRDLLAEILVMAGYAAMPVSSGEEALDILRTRKVDLVITDLMMPGMTGIQLVEAAAQAHPQLPFIVLTAHGTIEIARESLQRGAVDFLTKPVNARELVIAVERNLERRRIEEKRLREATSEVLFEAIQSLAATIDLRDPYTAGHSRRAAEVAERMAVAAGVSDEDRYVLRLAGAMHDIGKIGVRDAVLQKPGCLDDEEWTEMRMHPHHGSEVLNNVQGLRQVATIIRHHHENVDGTGYPDGLRGDAIPYLARMLAVADAYEALTSDRSYRKAMSREEAFSLLRSEVGHRFDADMVELLIRVEGGGDT